MAIRSCTHRIGLPALVWASKNPVQPPSRGWIEKISHNVGCCGLGKLQASREGRNPTGNPSFAGVLPPDAETAPPATRDRPLATRLTTSLFYFCSYPASPDEESMARLAIHSALDRRPPFDRSEESLNFIDDLA